MTNLWFVYNSFFVKPPFEKSVDVEFLVSDVQIKIVNISFAEILFNRTVINCPTLFVCRFYAFYL